MSVPTLDLSGFHGTSAYHRLTMTPMLATDGVRYFAEKGGCFWLMDIIATEIRPRLQDEVFISIFVHVADERASIEAGDGNDGTLYRRQIEYTDCPPGDYRLYLVDDVLMLASEY